MLWFGVRRAKGTPCGRTTSTQRYEQTAAIWRGRALLALFCVRPAGATAAAAAAAVCIQRWAVCMYAPVQVEFTADSLCGLMQTKFLVFQGGKPDRDHALRECKGWRLGIGTPKQSGEFQLSASKTNPCCVAINRAVLPRPRPYLFADRLTQDLSRSL